MAQNYSIIDIQVDADVLRSLFTEDEIAAMQEDNS